MENNYEQPHSSRVANLIIGQIDNYESTTIDLSNKVTFSQYDTVQTILTHQNHGFLTALAPGQVDDREFYDIVTPMIETAVANTDLDTDNIDAYTDNPDYLAHEYFAQLGAARSAAG